MKEEEEERHKNKVVAMVGVKKQEAEGEMIYGQDRAAEKRRKCRILSWSFGRVFHLCSRIDRRSERLAEGGPRTQETKLQRS